MAKGKTKILHRQLAQARIIAKQQPVNDYKYTHCGVTVKVHNDCTVYSGYNNYNSYQNVTYLFNPVTVQNQTKKVLKLLDDTWDPDLRNLYANAIADLAREL